MARAGECEYVKCLIPVLWGSGLRLRCCWPVSTELAEAQGVNRSAAIKAAILEATVPEHATAIADKHEVLVLLSEAARGGSVSAMKVLLAHHRLPRPAAVDPIFAELDELRPARPCEPDARRRMSLAPMAPRDACRPRARPVRPAVALLHRGGTGARPHVQLEVDHKREESDG